MTTREGIRDALTEGLAAIPIRRRGYWWTWESDELVWSLYLDRLPYGRRLTIDVGVKTRTVEDRALPRPDDCAIVTGIEMMKLGTTPDAIRVLDLEHQMDEGSRLRAVREIGAALAEYVKRRSTWDSLVAAYNLGEMDSFFIHRDIRARLEGR